MTTKTIQTAVTIDAAADAAWTLLGEGFADWADWAPGIDTSTLEGPLPLGVVRVNATPSLGTVRQELVRFDREGRALAYEMRAGLPPVFSSLRNDWVIEDLGEGRCRLAGDARFELKGEAVAMWPKLEGKMGMALEVFARSVREQLEGSAEG